MNDDQLRSAFHPEPLLLTPSEAQLARVTGRVRRRRQLRVAALAGIGGLALAGVFSIASIVTRDGPSPQTLATSPLPSASLSPGFAGPTLPADASVVDLSWTGAENGWVLADDACTPSGQCAMHVGHTTDGGASWTAASELPDFAAKGYRGLVRFADPQHGYVAVDGTLVLTSDGGATWTSAGLGGFVLAVETTRSSTVALVNSVDDQQCLDCAVFRSTTGDSSWHRVVTVNGKPLAAMARAGDLVVTIGFINAAGGAPSAEADVSRSVDGGQTWSSVADPCATRGAGQFAVGVTAISDVVAYSCIADRSAGTSYVLLSSDGGETASAVVHPPCPSDIALASRSTFACHGVSPEEPVRVSHDGGQTWHAVRAAPWVDGSAYWLGFENPLVGRSASGHSVWTTRDGGDTWAEHRLAPVG